MSIDKIMAVITVSNAVQAEIEKAVVAITNTMQPRMIYLFGSQSDNTANMNSDIDLCVVASLSGIRKIDALRKMRQAMAAEVTMPVDLLVYDNEDFAARSALSSTMEHKIASLGKLLYGQ